MVYGEHYEKETNLKRLGIYLMVLTMGLLLLTACSVESGSSDQTEVNQTKTENEDKAVENIDDADNLDDELPVIEDNADSKELQLIILDVISLISETAKCELFLFA